MFITTRGMINADESVHARGIFPDECMICKKKYLKVKQKTQPLTKIITKTVEKMLKDAELLADDRAMLLAVIDVDVIAKEFKKYDKCYREYTKVAGEDLVTKKRVWMISVVITTL